MIEKTRGIILHHIKYTDTSVVAQLYTRKFGRQSFLIKGMGNRKSGKHNILFQPMLILDLEMYYKSSRELQTLKEFSISFIPYEIHSNIKKSCITMFLGEVLATILKEESPHEELFDYVERSIVYFEKCNERYSNFHIAFLTGLSRFLGFEPSQQINSDDLFFDLKNGKFIPLPPTHGNYANEEISKILSHFFSYPVENSIDISLSSRQRNETLEILIDYYSLHLPGLKKINSLEVLKEVFR